MRSYRDLDEAYSKLRHYRVGMLKHKLLAWEIAAHQGCRMPAHTELEDFAMESMLALIPEIESEEEFDLRRKTFIEILRYEIGRFWDNASENPTNSQNLDPEDMVWWDEEDEIVVCQTCGCISKGPHGT